MIRILADAYGFLSVSIRSYRKWPCDCSIRETVLLSVTAHDYIIDIVHHRNVLIKMHIFRWR